MKMPFLYAISAWGEPRYVGKSNDPEKRFKQHLSCAKRGKKSHLYNWLRSVTEGGETPRLEILFQVPDAEWELWERFLIAGFKAEGFPLVNQTPGGEVCFDCTGRKHSPETKRKISESHTGKTFSSESRAKMSESMRGNTRNCGRKHSPKHVENNRLSKLGKKQSPEAVEANRAGQQSRAPMRHNKCGYKGVSLDPRRNKWRARVHHNGKEVFFQYCNTAEDAARARDEAALRLIGPHVYLNFPK